GRAPRAGRRYDPPLPNGQSLPLCRLPGNHRGGEDRRAQAQGRPTGLTRRRREENEMTDATVAGAGPWYKALDRGQWNTLIAANLGWLFDGYETFALVISVGVALRQLLDPSQYGQIPAYAGTVIAVTLLGWGVG